LESEGSQSRGSVYITIGVPIATQTYHILLLAYFSFCKLE
jgi:hypothetical protein